MASGIIVGLGTKRDLMIEYIRLEKELEDLQRRFGVVHNLSEKYTSCKHHIPLRRYWELKNMLRDCVAEYNRVLQIEREENRESGNLVPPIQVFSNTSAELSAAMKEVSNLHKSEIVAGIKEMTRQISKLGQNKLRLHDRLDKLERDYAESKRNFPFTRYRLMKEMIKTLINDKRLNVNW